MENRDFDRLATEFAEGSMSRRRLLQGLMAGAGVALLTPILGAGRAEAAPPECNARCAAAGLRGKLKAKCVRGCKTCQSADDACINGETGDVSCCSRSQICFGNGTCHCPPDTNPCGGNCCDPSNETCSNGSCLVCSGAICGGTCCQLGEQCHPTTGTCCASSKVCGDVCCGELEVCSDPNTSTCCTSGQVCGDACCLFGQDCTGQGCCDHDQVCGDACCPSGQSCTGQGCCDDSQFCFDVCCPSGQTCAFDEFGDPFCN
jgi:hypothetical protein